MKRLRAIAASLALALAPGLAGGQSSLQSRSLPSVGSPAAGGGTVDNTARSTAATALTQAQQAAAAAASAMTAAAAKPSIGTTAGTAREAAAAIAAENAANSAATNAASAVMSEATRAQTAEGALLPKGTTLAGLSLSSNPTAPQVAAALPTVSTSAPGLVPTLPGGTASFLRADGSYAAPPGIGSVAGLPVASNPSAAQTAAALVGTAAGTLAAGNDSRITGALPASAAGPLATQSGANPSAAIAAALGFTPIAASGAPVQSVAGLTGAPTAAQIASALPPASTTQLGPVKVDGSSVTVDGSSVLHAASASPATPTTLGTMRFPAGGAVTVTSGGVGSSAPVDQQFDDLANTSGLGACVMLRNVVSLPALSKCGGLVFGPTTFAQRLTNGTVLQAAINYASTHQKVLEATTGNGMSTSTAGGGALEVYTYTPVTVPAATGIFWQGSKSFQLVQFNCSIPAFVLGDATDAVAATSNITFDGLSTSYPGWTQSGTWTGTIAGNSNVLSIAAGSVTGNITPGQAVSYSGAPGGLTIQSSNANGTYTLNQTVATAASGVSMSGSIRYCTTGQVNATGFLFGSAFYANVRNIGVGEPYLNSTANGGDGFVYTSSPPYVGYLEPYAAGSTGFFSNEVNEVEVRSAQYSLMIAANVGTGNHRHQYYLANGGNQNSDPLSGRGYVISDAVRFGSLPYNAADPSNLTPGNAGYAGGSDNSIDRFNIEAVSVGGAVWHNVAQNNMKMNALHVEGVGLQGSSAAPGAGSSVLRLEGGEFFADATQFLEMSSVIAQGGTISLSGTTATIGTPPTYGCYTPGALLSNSTPANSAAGTIPYYNGVTVATAPASCTAGTTFTVSSNPMGTVSNASVTAYANNATIINLNGNGIQGTGESCHINGLDLNWQFTTSSLNYKTPIVQYGGGNYSNLPIDCQINTLKIIDVSNAAVPFMWLDTVNAEQLPAGTLIGNYNAHPFAPQTERLQAPILLSGNGTFDHYAHNHHVRYFVPATLTANSVFNAHAVYGSGTTNGATQPAQVGDTIEIERVGGGSATLVANSVAANGTVTQVSANVASGGGRLLMFFNGANYVSYN